MTEMILVRVYGEGGGVFFARNIAVSPVTAVNKAALHLTLKFAALTHTQTNESYAWWKKKYLKHVHILENICIINDLPYSPETHPQIIRMHFFITRPAYYPQRPRI